MDEKLTPGEHIGRYLAMLENKRRFLEAATEAQLNARRTADEAVFAASAGYLSVAARMQERSSDWHQQAVGYMAAAEAADH